MRCFSSTEYFCATVLSTVSIWLLALTFIALIRGGQSIDEIHDDPSATVRKLPLPASLDVHHVRLFARAPVQGEEKVVALSVWLKRISPAEAAVGDGGGGHGAASSSSSSSSSYLLPTQTAAVEGFAWADDLGNLTNNKFGKFMTVVDAHVWRPRLRLQVWGSDEVVLSTPHPALVRPGGELLPHPWSHLRAFFFSFPLESKSSARCFKVYEESFPDNKAPFCLPASSTGMCSRLAPDRSFTPSRPALWAVLVPFRSWGLAGSQWDLHMRRVAHRVQHYVSYFRSIGGTGLLLYADRFSSQALERYPAVRRMLLDGTLVLVAWEHIERLQYNADQALVYSHAFLGLSSCGANLWLQIADVDELLYSPYGRSWPGMFDCLRQSASAGNESAALFQLRRLNIIASRVGAEAEAALWYSAPDPGADGDEMHRPLDRYDKASQLPYKAAASKYLACPAHRMVSVWVHDALPLYGAWHEGNASCAFLLHLPNYWKPREPDDARVFMPFRLGRVRPVRRDS